MSRRSYRLYNEHEDKKKSQAYTNGWKFDDYLFVSEAKFFFPSGRKLYRWKITCTCTGELSGSFPKSIIAVGIVPLVICPECKQGYVLFKKSISKVEDFKTIKGVIHKTY